MSFNKIWNIGLFYIVVDYCYFQIYFLNTYATGKCSWYFMFCTVSTEQLLHIFCFPRIMLYILTEAEQSSFVF